MTGGAQGPMEEDAVPIALMLMAGALPSPSSLPWALPVQLPVLALLWLPQALGVSGELSPFCLVSLQEDRGLPAPAGGLPVQEVLPLQAKAVLYQQGHPQLRPHPQGQGAQEPAEAGEQ